MRILSVAILGIALLFAATFVFARMQTSVTIEHRVSEEIGDEIVVRFPQWVSERQALGAFHIEPEVAGQRVWLRKYRELHFVPHEGFVPGTPYRATVTLHHPLFAGRVGKTYTLAVTTEAATQQPYYSPAVLEGKYIDINLATMQLALVENGVVVQEFPVAGKGNPWSTPTREGVFKVLSKEERHWSTIYKLWMPFSMNYSGDYFIHGWPYWPNGVPLTSVYSGGCMRLHDDVARAVFDFAEINTTVVVHSTPRAMLLAERALGDGDLAREASDFRVFLVKQIGNKKFKRHIPTEDIQHWYPHLFPFRAKVKVVPTGTLAAYLESRWVRAAHNPVLVYEIDSQGIKHQKTCPEHENCLVAWSRLGWDLDEIFEVNEAELAFYPAGEPWALKTAAWVAP